MPAKKVGFASPACSLADLDPGQDAPDIQIKRVYARPSAADGRRVLVDRLWPRGLTKQKAAVHAWLRDLAPSTALRQWFNHDPSRWVEFQRRYRAELRPNRAALRALLADVGRQRLTLVYGSREPKINHAVVLRQVLLRQAADTGRPARATSAPRQ